MNPPGVQNGTPEHPNGVLGCRKSSPGDPNGVRATPTWQINGGGGIDLPCGRFLGPFCLTAHPAHAAHAKTHMPAQLHAHACTCPHMPKKVILVEVFACTCLRLLPHMPHSPPRTCPHSRTAHAAHAFGPTGAKCIPPRGSSGLFWLAPGPLK